MNILLVCLSYREFTGSEIYFYELSTALRDANNNVSIFSPFADHPLRSKSNNINFPSREDIENTEYDLVIFSHGKILWEYIKNVKTKKLINVIHSKVLELEEPVLSNKIDLYVGIRPSIVKYIVDKTPSSSKRVKLIYNPFDFNRFNPKDCKKKKNIKEKVVIFPGSLDYLRYQPLQYLLKLSEKQNFKVLHVGRNDYTTVHPNFTTTPSIWKMEKEYKKCDIVSGIFLGRTSIEGLLCNKKVLQFDVDKTGKIKKVYWHTEDDLEKFNKHSVAKEFLNV